MIYEHDLQIYIKNYLEDQISDDEIIQIFSQLVNMVLTHRGWNLGQDILTEAAELCLDKLPRYDNSKGKAFNFLTTIITCYLGQARRTQMRKQELNANYLL